MECVTTGQSANIVIVLNCIQTDCTRVAGVRKHFGGNGLANMVAFVVVLVNVVLFNDRMFPFLFHGIRVPVLFGVLGFSRRLAFW